MRNQNIGGGGMSSGGGYYNQINNEQFFAHRGAPSFQPTVAAASSASTASVPAGVGPGAAAGTQEYIPGPRNYFNQTLNGMKSNGGLTRATNSQLDLDIEKKIKKNTGDYMQIYLNQKAQQQMQQKILSDDQNPSRAGGSYSQRAGRSTTKPSNATTSDYAKPPATAYQPRYFEQIDGVYEGDVDMNYKKEGLGVFIADSGEVYTGEWTGDQMHGEGILNFAFGGYVYGQFRANKVHGVALLSIPQHSLSISYWKQSRRHGKSFELDIKLLKWSIVEYLNGVETGVGPSEQAEISSAGVSKPRLMEGYEDIRWWMERLSKKQYFMEREQDVLGKHLRHLNIESGLDYIGYLENKQIPSGLGFVSFENRMIYGNFRNGVLERQGRMLLDNGDIYDGSFSAGQFHGNGVYYNFKDNSFMVGTFAENKPINIINKGTDYPTALIAKMKHDLHRFSKKYYQKECGFSKLQVIQDYSPLLFEQYKRIYSLQQIDDQNLDTSDDEYQEQQDAEAAFQSRLPNINNNNNHMNSNSNPIQDSPWQQFSENDKKQSNQFGNSLLGRIAAQQQQPQQQLSLFSLQNQQEFESIPLKSQNQFQPNSYISSLQSSPSQPYSITQHKPPQQQQQQSNNNNNNIQQQPTQSHSGSPSRTSQNDNSTFSAAVAATTQPQQNNNSKPNQQSDPLGNIFNSAASNNSANNNNNNNTNYQSFQSRPLTSPFQINRDASTNNSPRETNKQVTKESQSSSPPKKWQTTEDNLFRNPSEDVSSSSAVSATVAPSDRKQQQLQSNHSPILLQRSRISESALTKPRIVRPKSEFSYTNQVQYENFKAYKEEKAMSTIGQNRQGEFVFLESESQPSKLVKVNEEYLNNQLYEASKASRSKSPMFSNYNNITESLNQERAEKARSSFRQQRNRKQALLAEISLDKQMTMKKSNFTLQAGFQIFNEADNSNQQELQDEYGDPVDSVNQVWAYQPSSQTYVPARNTQMKLKVMELDQQKFQTNFKGSMSVATYRADLSVDAQLKLRKILIEEATSNLEKARRANRNTTQQLQQQQSQQQLQQQQQPQHLLASSTTQDANALLKATPSANLLSKQKDEIDSSMISQPTVQPPHIKFTEKQKWALDPVHEFYKIQIEALKQHKSKLQSSQQKANEEEQGTPHLGRQSNLTNRLIPAGEMARSIIDKEIRQSKRGIFEPLEKSDFDLNRSNSTFFKSNLPQQIKELSQSRSRKQIFETSNAQQLFFEKKQMLATEYNLLFGASNAVAAANAASSANREIDRTSQVMGLSASNPRAVFHPAISSISNNNNNTTSQFVNASASYNDSNFNNQQPQFLNYSQFQQHQQQPSQNQSYSLMNETTSSHPKISRFAGIKSSNISSEFDNQSSMLINNSDRIRSIQQPNMNHSQTTSNLINDDFNPYSNSTYKSNNNNLNNISNFLRGSTSAVGFGEKQETFISEAAPPPNGLAEADSAIAQALNEQQPRQNPRFEQSNHRIHKSSWDQIEPASDVKRGTSAIAFKQDNQNSAINKDSLPTIIVHNDPSSPRRVPAGRPID